MKIKNVCEKTGLTDRTVRYYIEEGLISPAYTENYLGRKSFDFSDEDIAELNNIATLRNFDFSIEEIKGMLFDPTSSPAIIRETKERLTANLMLNQKKVYALSSLNGDRIYTVAELAETLAKPEDIAPSDEVIKLNLPRKFLAMMKGTLKFTAVWLPIILGCTIIIVNGMRYENPVINTFFAVFTVIILFPSFVSMFTSKVKVLQHTVVKKALLILCLLCIPLSIIGAFGTVKECKHVWSELAVESKASCSSEGRFVRKCNLCRGVDVVIEKKLPHTEKTVSALAPTCDTDGHTEGRRCSTCQEITVESKVIPKMGHSYVKSHVKATCSESGYTYYECSICDYGYKDDILPNTEEHTFRKNGELGYICSECDLEVCKYGYADGGYYSNSNVKYYITGIIDDQNEVERTLVIYGNGSMPTPATESYHPWRDRAFAEEIRHVVICEGVTSIASGAFSAANSNDNWMGNPFHSVESFTVKNKNLKVKENDPNVDGIECEITYSY